jgi:Cytochrome c554 and c-prime
MLAESGGDAWLSSIPLFLPRRMSLYAYAAILIAFSLVGIQNGRSQTAPRPAPIEVPAKDVEKSDSSGDFAGDAACQPCHAEKVAGFHQTAHSLTSRLPQAGSILGGFAPGENVMKTANPDLFFRMEQKGSDFFQTAVTGVAPFITERSERFAFVIGSGGKGQTYLYWKGDDLFQLPVSYWRELGWVNSPGYRDGVANFNRPVIPRCLECHASYFHSMPPPVNRYSKDGVVLGITCEKCHGAGRLHIQRHMAGSAANSSPDVLNPSGFSRDRQMDLCAWCHAGAGDPIEASFSYLPGEQLDRFLKLPDPNPGAPIDVHGSQVELLQRSRCYQKSEMTCLTCHDVHSVEHDLRTFSKRCLSCHKPESAMFPKQNHQADSNCVDCHMPLQQTGLIVFDQNGKRTSPKIRNHWIKVYAESAANAGK